MSNIKKEELPVSSNVTRQKLEDAEAELKELLIRKKQVDKSLKTIEKHIWNFEGSYLEETHSGGNLIRGFDGYLRATNDKKKRSEITREERLFSLSSATSEKAVGLVDDSSSSSDDLKSGYNKQIGPSLKKKRKQQRPTNYIYPQEVKEAKDNREVRRIRLPVRDRDEKDTEEEVDI
ncbi:histone acetyltransferase subunit NuA4-domain-containing protein [Gigaspora rosea]|uniref:Chromatin modification-related protein EAF6 n=1 Tax=Gigaspora rosea TaxID=44941 RepID=A0A397UII2_9GLOM|nr:histone acetyltransferase subunit NuA4-domain-containing protein [Gigaspora rosea]